MRSSSVEQLPAPQCSALDVIADFYREEFLKRQAQLRLQREYYSERRRGRRGSRAQPHPHADRHAVRARPRRPIGQPALAMHRHGHRRPGRGRPEEGSLTSALATLRQDALAIVRAALSSADTRACVAARPSGGRAGRRRVATLASDCGGEGRRAHGVRVPGGSVAPARAGDGGVAGAADRGAAPASSTSWAAIPFRRRAVSPRAGARSRSPHRHPPATCWSCCCREARPPCSKRRRMACRWRTCRPPRRACSARGPTSRP